MKYSSLNDRIAITTRISTGIAVQAISSTVLWVRRDGTGLRVARKRKQARASSPSTNAEIATMMNSSRSCSDSIMSMTGEAAG